MSDDIPVAQRQTLGSRSAWLSSVRRRRRWGRLLLGGILGIFVVVLVSWQFLPDQPSPAAEVARPSPIGIPASPENKPVVLGHYAYAEAPLTSLQEVGAYQGRRIQLQVTAASSYSKMAEAARRDGISLVPISGFRTIADQEYLFFQRAQEKALRPQERASVSAPPGYSEHHTGYAIDIGDAQFPATDTEVGFEETAAFAWLETNAARFGFELSFPRSNPQGVSYEPWHWRYVGDRASLETFYAQSAATPTP
ncbi:MAG: D-alanyl-D-alanine carboxypeptidase family protein [Cyanobacteriota bacterium]|nr:D-alanyl-D-alanine carboxypeptidase family protein [Cyanobacteriota bacterium]